MKIQRRKLHLLDSAKTLFQTRAGFILLLVFVAPIVALSIIKPFAHAAASPIGEWKLDEGTGNTVADTSGNGNNGTIVGTGTSPTWISPGHDASVPFALDFDGSGAPASATNSVNLGNSPILDQMDNYTVSLWVKFKPGYVGGGGPWANLVGRTAANADWAWMVYVNNVGHIRPHHRNSNGSFAPLTDSATTMPVGEWVHIEQVADGGQLHLYINGQEDANFPIPYSGTTYSLPTGNAYIGQDTREYAPLATISDVKIYNDASIAPQVVTDAATNITQQSATLNGTLSSLGDFMIADVFFRYRVAGSSGPYAETPGHPITAADSFSENISGLAPSTQYEFFSVVRWQGRDGLQQATGSTNTFTTANAPVIASAPLNLQAVSNSSSQINLSWDAPASDGGNTITGYQIERSLDGTVWSTIVSNTGNTDVTYVDTGLNSDTQYFYHVSAINAIGTGLPSNVADATTDKQSPEVITSSPTDISTNSAVLVGRLDSLGDFTTADVFFKYRRVGSNDSFAETATQTLTAPGAFSQKITALTSSARYEFLAVVRWTDGTTQELVGSQGIFITSSTVPSAPNTGSGLGGVGANLYVLITGVLLLITAGLLRAFKWHKEKQ